MIDEIDNSFIGHKISIFSNEGYLILVVEGEVDFVFFFFVIVPITG